jgi:hypothetical protein
MMTMLDVALDCIRRGWYVFPCWPKTKKPMTKAGFKDAFCDELVARSWWDQHPHANVAIATGPSGLCVVDLDHGMTADNLVTWLMEHGMDATYAIHTGRRPEFGVQLYYSGTGLKSTGWKDGEVSGDIRCSTGYVMAAGSIHPDSGEPYTVLWGGPLQPVPEFVRGLTAQATDRPDAVTVPDDVADEWKTWLLEYADFYGIAVKEEFEKRAVNGWWIGIHCPWESEHSSGAGSTSSTVLGILDGRIAFECSHTSCKAARRGTAAFTELMLARRGNYLPEPGVGPGVTLGSTLEREDPYANEPKEPVDWRTLFHSRDDVLNCPKPTFLIQDFLQCGSICAIAAPVAQRKSLIVLNVIHSLCTGDKLFGHLPVCNRPTRVLYLCPEMGLVSLGDRVQRIGLTDYLGDTLFIRSMNLPTLPLKELPEEALPGSVLILDTAARFTEGDENSVSDMKAFSNELFALQRAQGDTGAIIILYHSPKSTKESSELTLENCLRGSGELGAAITDGHGTRLQDPEDTHGSPSFIRHIKARDYKGLPDFEVYGDDNGLLTAREDPYTSTIRLAVAIGGNKADTDGKDAAGKALIQANKEKTVPELMKLLREHDIKRGKTWVGDARKEARGETGGAKLTKG